MLVSQICNLGKVTLGDKTQFQVLIDAQKEYKSKYFLLAKVDFSTDDSIDLNLIEYDNEKRYDYARGTVSGKGCCLSPSVNVKWDDMKEAEFEKNYQIESKVVNLIGKIGKIINKINIKEYKGTYVEKFFKWLYPNNDFKDYTFISKLRKKIIDYLVKKRSLSRNERPTLIIFGFKDKNIITIYPGELKEFKKLYLEIKHSSGKKKQIITSRKCYICGNERDDLESFNWGVFTLDKDSFNIGFQNKNNQNQYLLCQKCRIFCREGLNFIEKSLKFYAFSIKKGKDTMSVYHYLIPNCVEPVNLDRKITSLNNIKKEINLKKYEDAVKQIKSLDQKIQKAKRENIRDLRKKINTLKKKQESFKNNENINIDLFEILNEYKHLQLSFIDVYFLYIDKKQNPPTKEILNVFFISKTRIEELSKIFEEIKAKNSLKGFYFWWLKDLIGQSNYFYYLEALFNSDKINHKEFLKNSHRFLSKAYKNEYFVRKQSYFRNKLFNFKIFYDLFKEVKILT